MYHNNLTLPNGNRIPQLALGTWFIDDDKVADAVRAAIEIGYRHIDTAQAYFNERGVGEGVRKSGVPRSEIFVTTKVDAGIKTYAEAAASIDGSLQALGLDYIDLMLIHGPQSWLEANQSDDRHPQGNREVWRALEDACKAGKVKAIGLSNFLEGDIENIWAAAEIKPMVNQILCHIANTPLALIEYCRRKGILLEAYSPVAHGEALKLQSIQDMAKKYGVSAPQLCIKYDLQLGMIALPKTANPDHMRSNADLDFVISDEDMEALMHVEKMTDYGAAGFLPVYGGKLDPTMFGGNG